MKNLENAILAFEPISLQNMDKVSLMNRNDCKYIFNESLLPNLLSDLSKHYHILEIDNQRLMQYRSLYFDTADFRFYTMHHNKRSRRVKVRMREYLTTGDIFFEIKLKTNKGKTNKKRVSIPELYKEIKPELQEFLLSKAPDVSMELHPSLWVYFDRITLINLQQAERVTIDTNIHVAFNGDEKNFPGLVILETKQPKNIQSNTTRILKDHHILPISISKYCIGMSEIYADVKHNNLKRKHTIIKKISTYGSH